MSLADDLKQFEADAQAFIASVENFAASAFGSNPLASAISGLAKDLKADIESAIVTVNGVDQALIATKPMFDQVVGFVSNAKAQAKADPTASDWETVALNLLSVGIPIALNVVAPGAGPLVSLSMPVIERLLAML
jgi:hypothetical protein